MCLDKITKTYEPNDRMAECYKVFNRDCDVLYSGFRETEVPRIVGIHYVATDGLVGTYSNSKYEVGFHGFVSLEGAQQGAASSEVVAKVLLWDIRAKGLEIGAKVIVAKNMRIMEVLE